MGTNTTKLGLLKPSENDFYNQQTEQADNWEKVDKFADDIQNLVDNNSGKKITGYIQDSGEKILGNYYLDKLATGLFKCIKSGNINYNSSEYFENDSNYALSDKLKNLVLSSERVTKIDNGNTRVVIVNCHVDIDGYVLGSGGEILSLGIYGNDIVNGAQGSGALSDESNNFIPCTFLKNSDNKIQIFFEKDKLLATGNYSIRGSLISFSPSK